MVLITSCGPIALNSMDVSLDDAVFLKTSHSLVICSGSTRRLKCLDSDLSLS